MAANAKKHRFSHAGKEFIITANWVTDDPVTFTFKVETKDSHTGKAEPYGTLKRTGDEGAYGQAFIESDTFVAEAMKMIEKAVKAKKAK